MKNAKKLITALATPYKNGEIDESSYVNLLRYQQENGVCGVAVASTTGEGNLLSSKEKLRLFNLAKNNFFGEIWVNVADASTKTAGKNAEFWKDNGADGILVSPPPFCKCTAPGYAAHIRQIREHAPNIPVMLYNVPSRAAYELNLDAVKRISQLGGISLKDAGNDLSYTKKACEITEVLCGNDEKLYDFVNAGARGAVSVVSNVAPILTDTVLNGQADDGYFVTLAKLTMREISPIAVKYMLYKAGLFASYEMRLPLTAASEITRRAIDEAWQKEKIR